MTVEPSEESEFGRQPRDQERFVEAAVAAQKLVGTTDNELKLGAAMRKRDEKLCKAIGSDGSAAGWTGRITNLSSNNDGLGVLEIEVAPDVHIATWNNAFSDAGDNTLIRGQLLDRLIDMEEGQLVKFSGRFIEDSDGNCFHNSRLTLSGKVAAPRFIFRYKQVTEIE